MKKPFYDQHGYYRVVVISMQSATFGKFYIPTVPAFYINPTKSPLLINCWLYNRQLRTLESFLDIRHIQLIFVGLQVTALSVRDL